ncbi:MAG TPA: hypothetical protein VLL08_22425 [Kineosporiaceae bacterium]|nr:hypothetical protein [Kineosporiaceae bacterium]
MGGISVTDDLLSRSFGAAQVGPVDERRLLVTYVRASDLDRVDPRERVLRPSHTWAIGQGSTLGMGRAPSGVDIAVPLIEEDGLQDNAVPRLAARLSAREGQWWISNHASGSASIVVSGPGAQEELRGSSPEYPIRRRRSIVTVRSRSTGPSGAHPVEHRLTLFAPWFPDDLPDAPSMPSRPSDGKGTTDVVGAPGWSWAHQRLLAAWAYPELIGLASRGQPRGRMTRLLLRQMLEGDDPNERLLSGLRRRAARHLGVPLVGEVHTPAFLDYVVARRQYLGDALVDLHAEYDTLTRGRRSQP